MGYRLKRRETVGDGMRRIALEQVAKLVEALQLPNSDSAIHEGRKRCKRIRAVVRLLRQPCPEIYEYENAFFRDLARSLSQLRDMKVRDDAFRKLVSAEPRGLQRYAPIRVLLQHDGGQMQNGETAAAIAAALKNARTCEDRVRSWTLPDDAGFELVRDGLRKAYKSGRKAMEVAYENGDSEGEAFHDWRKRVKDLGYQVQILRNLWPPLLQALHHELGELGELLGEEHDLILLRGALDDRGAEEVDGQKYDAFQRLLKRRAKGLRRDARDSGERIYAEKVGAFIKRIEAYWVVWRK